MRTVEARTAGLGRLALTILVCVTAAACSDDGDGGDLGTTTTSVVAGTTTSTTSSTTNSGTSTTTSTSGGASTTTTNPEGSFSCGCDVVFAVTNTETLGALQFDTQYPGALGTFDGLGSSVNCSRLAGDFAAFNDEDTEDTLSTAIVSTAGFTGPIDIALCTYSSGLPEPVTSDFVITVTDQSRPDFSPANATVAVRDVTCTCTGGNTTTTTTTLPEVGDPYLVSFDLDDAVTLGSLGIEIDYGSAGGNFAGRGSNVDCTSPLTSAGGLVSFHDSDASAQLNFAGISATGFSGPMIIATCTFLAPGAPPSPGDFVIDVVDAATPDFQPVEPTVSVSAITPETP